MGYLYNSYSVKHTV